MPNVTILKTDGSKAGELELSPQVFGVEVNASVIHQTVVAQLANARQGTQCALTRSEVRGGGIKPWRQKGTGRARQGSIRSPQWTKGGVVFAPKPRDYSKKVNKKAKRLALKSALSMKVADSDFIVLDDLKLSAAKTKEMVKILSNIGANGKALIITADVDKDVVRATNNLQGIKTTFTGSISVYDIMNCGKLIVTKDAVKCIEEVYA